MRTSRWQQKWTNSDAEKKGFHALRAELPKIFAMLHEAQAEVVAQGYCCPWSMQFGSRGGSKSVLISQSGNERDVVHVIFPAQDESEVKDEGKAK